MKINFSGSRFVVVSIALALVLMLLPSHLLAQRSQPVPKASPSQRLQPVPKVQPAQKAQPADAFAILYYEMMKRHLKDCIDMPKACGKFSEEDFWKMIGRSPVVLNDVIVFVKNNYKNSTGDIMKKEVGEIFKKLYAAGNPGASTRDRAAAREELNRITPKKDAHDSARLIHIGDVGIAEALGLKYADFKRLNMMKQLSYDWIKKLEAEMGGEGGGGGGGGGDKGEGGGSGPTPMPSVGGGIANAAECMKGGGGTKMAKGPKGGFGPGGPSPNVPEGPDSPGWKPGQSYGYDDKPLLPNEGDLNKKPTEDCNPFLEGPNKGEQVGKLGDWKKTFEDPSNIKKIHVRTNGLNYSGHEYVFSGWENKDGQWTGHYSKNIYVGHWDLETGVLDAETGFGFETTKSAEELMNEIDAIPKDEVVVTYTDGDGDAFYDPLTPVTETGSETPSPTEGGGEGPCSSADALMQMFACLNALNSKPCIGGAAKPDPGGGDFAEPQFTNDCPRGGGGAMLWLPSDGYTDPNPQDLIMLKDLISSGASQADIKNAAMKAFGGKGP